MLILKRRRDQVIRIGPDVIVQVIKIEYGAVVLGITAPADWNVSRDDNQMPEGTDDASQTIRSSGNDGLP